MNNENKNDYVILLPLYNDWNCLKHLLKQIDDQCKNLDFTFQVLVVDDCSFEQPKEISISIFSSIEKLSILRLSRNAGHQKAIAMGLRYVSDNIKTSGVIIMDSDGEDNPVYISEFIQKAKDVKFQKMIFASRKKRSEGFVFRLFYSLFKIAFFVLTGARIKFGNFSFIPSSLIGQIAFIPQIQSHFAAAVLKSRIQFTEIETVRASRIDGKSKMNFVGLVMHGLSAISVYSDIIGVRSITFAVSILCLTFIGMIAVISMKLFTNLAIPGWASQVAFLLFITFLQSLVLLVVFTFLVLQRNDVGVVESKVVDLD